MTEEEVRCQRCLKNLKVQIYHAGFGDVVPYTCDRDSTVLTVSTYEKKLNEVLGTSPRGAWVDSDHRKVEAKLMSCPCGGAYKHDALPKCPNCGAILRVERLGPEEFVVVGRLIDGDKQNVWRS